MSTTLTMPADVSIQTDDVEQSTAPELGLWSGPEDNPADDVPADKDEYEKWENASTPVGDDDDATPPDNGDDASDAPELDEGELDEVGQVEDATTLADELPPGSVTEATQTAAETVDALRAAGGDAIDNVADRESIHDTTTGPPAATRTVNESYLAKARAHIDFQRTLSESSANMVAAVLARVAAEGALKAAKTAEKAAIESIQRIIERGPEELPLFDRKVVSEEVKHHCTNKETPASESAATDPIDDDSWRTTPLSAIPGIPARALKALAELDVTTIGELADATADGGKLTDLKGIGKSAAEKIQEAAEQWHKERLASQGATEVEPTIDEVADAVVAEMNEQLSAAPLDSDHTTDVDLLDSNGVPVDWREVSCEHLSVTEAVLNKIYRQGLETLGDLADWLADSRNDVATIGGKKAGEKIVAAFEALRAKYEGAVGRAGHGEAVEVAASEDPTAEDDVLE